MRCLDLWFTRTLLLHFLIAWLILLGVQFLFDVATELARTVEGYGMPEMLHFLITAMPRRAYQYYPYAWLIAILVVLGGMARNRELVVLRASGMGHWRLLQLVLFPLLLCALLAMAAYEYLVIPSRHAVQQLRVEYHQKNIAGPLEETWFRDQDRFLSIGGADDKDNLYDVFIVETEALQQLQRVIRAPRARFDASRQHWVLYQAQSFVLPPAASETKITPIRHYDEELPWGMGLRPDFVRWLAMDPELLNIAALWQLEQFLRPQNGGSNPYSLQLWRRLLLPISTAALGWLALTCVFSFARNSATGARVFMGLSLAMGFDILQKILGALFLNLQWPAFAAVLLVILLSGGLGFGLMLRR